MSRLYWVGIYEGSNKWKWFFPVDFAPAIGYFPMRAIGECKHVAGRVALVLT
jgi:5'-3' exonuclease